MSVGRKEKEREESPPAPQTPMMHPCFVRVLHRFIKKIIYKTVKACISIFMSNYFISIQIPP